MMKRYKILILITILILIIVISMAYLIPVEISKKILGIGSTIVGIFAIVLATYGLMLIDKASQNQRDDE